MYLYIRYILIATYLYVPIYIYLYPSPSIALISRKSCNIRYNARKSLICLGFSRYSPRYIVDTFPQNPRFDPLFPTNGSPSTRQFGKICFLPVHSSQYFSTVLVKTQSKRKTPMRKSAKDPSNKDQTKNKTAKTHQYITNIYGNPQAVPLEVNISKAGSVVIHPTARFIFPKPDNAPDPNTREEVRKQVSAKVNIFGDCYLGPETIITIEPNNCLTLSNCNLNNISITMRAPSESYLTLDNVNCILPPSSTAQSLPANAKHIISISQPTDCPSPNRFNAKLENLRLSHSCKFYDIHWIQGLPASTLSRPNAKSKQKVTQKVRVLGRNHVDRKALVSTVELQERKMPSLPLELSNCEFHGPLTLRTHGRIQDLEIKLRPAIASLDTRPTPLHLTFNRDEIKSNAERYVHNNSDSMLTVMHQIQLVPNPDEEVNTEAISALESQMLQLEKQAQEQAQNQPKPAFKYFKQPIEPSDKEPKQKILPASVLGEISDLLGTKSNR